MGWIVRGLSRRIGLLLATCAMTTALALAPDATAEVRNGFSRDIRPVCTENRDACHGPAACAREAGPRLDVESKGSLAQYAAERVRTLAGTWLGLTLNRGGSQDRKDSPISTRDLDRLEVLFADLKEKGLDTSGDPGPKQIEPDPMLAGELAGLDARIAEVRETIACPTPKLAAAQAEWERSVLAPVRWRPLDPLTASSARGATLTIQPDGSILASGASPATDIYTVTASLPASGITALRLEVLPDRSLPRNGPGRAADGNFVLTELKASLQRAPGSPARALVLRHATATNDLTGAAGSIPPRAWTAAAAIDDDPRGAGWGWSVPGETGRANAAVFEVARDLDAGPDARLIITMVQEHEDAGHTLGRFRLSVTTAPRPAVAPGAGLPRAVRNALAVAPARRTLAQRETLACYFREIAPDLAPNRTHLAGLERTRAGLTAGISMRLATGAPPPPRPIRDPSQGRQMDFSGELRRLVDSTRPPETRRRLDWLDLAREFAAPENLSKARSLIDRLRMLVCGAGLASRLDGLIVQEERPGWEPAPRSGSLDWSAGGSGDWPRRSPAGAGARY